MEDKRRALTLTIDANSEQDMQMLLQQALYEIGRLLPLPPGASPEEVSRDAHRRMTTSWPSGERETKGHTQGSIGSYEFSFVRSSRGFKALEDQLLEQGYELRESQQIFDADFYAHPSLPSKIIAGDPLAIQDKPKATVEFL